MNNKLTAPKAILIGSFMIAGTILYTSGFPFSIFPEAKVEVAGKDYKSLVKDRDFYRAVNKPSYESKINLAFIIIYFVGYIISIKISFESFVFTRFLLAITALIGHLLLMKYALKTNILSIILDIIKTILIVIFSILISK